MIVETWMTREPLTVGVDANVSEAAAIMGAHKLRRLPVVQAGIVVGMVARSDLLRGQAVDPFSLATDHAHAPQRTIGAVMSRSLVTTRADTPLEDAARLMLGHKIGALPVVRDSGSLVGILTESDTLRALITSLYIEGPCTRLVFDGSDPDRLLTVLVERARALDLSIVGLLHAQGPDGREVIVTVRGRQGAGLADAAWSAGYRVKSVTERQA